MANHEELIKRKRIRIGDISISYLIREGTHPENTVLFIHGFPFNKNMWIPQLDSLPPHITGIALDVRGHGNSTVGHGFFSVDVFAKDLLAFLRKLSVEKSVLCGVSMGGYIALRAYQIQPEAFSGMILSDTHSLADDNAAKLKRFDTIQSVLKNGRRPFSIGFVNNVFSKKSLLENNGAIDLIKSSIRRNSLRTICATLLALASRTDTSSILTDITIPTLLIRGAQDRITSAEDMQEMADKIGNSVYEQIEHTGHLPNLEAPEAFNELLKKFLAKIS